MYYNILEVKQINMKVRMINMQYLLKVDNKWTDVTEEHFFRVINLHFDNLKVFETGGKTLYVLKGKQIAQIIG